MNLTQKSFSLDVKYLVKTLTCLLLGKVYLYNSGS